MKIKLDRDLHLTSGRWASALRDELQKIHDLRDAKATDEESLTAIMEFQREDGSFSLVSDYRIESDSRVWYVYRPTYACCQVLMRAFLQGADVAGLEEALGRGLAFCCGRGLKGHGFDGLRGQLEDVADFVDAGVVEFIEQNPEASPEFTRMIVAIAGHYAKRVETGNTFGDWGEDYTAAITKLAGALEPLRSSASLQGFLDVDDVRPA